MNLADEVHEGDAVRVQDASGEWHDAIATSGIEPGHKFPIVWVQFGSGGRSIPWPVLYVEHPREGD